jgi:hypothetical protein
MKKAKDEKRRRIKEQRWHTNKEIRKEMRDNG